MKLDDHFSSAMKQAVSNEPPVIDPRARFEQRASRSRRVRMVMSFAGAAALVVAAILVVPRILPESATPAPPATGEPTAGETPKATTGPDTSDWETYEGNGWSVKTPPDWKAGWFEGYTEIVPPGYKGTAVGEPTFALIVNVEPVAYTAVEFPAGGETSDGTWNDGHKYRQWHSTDEAKPRTETAFEFVPSACPAGSSPPCEAGKPQALRAVYHADTKALWDDFARYTDAMFTSITFTTPVEPKYGNIAPGIEMDAFTRTLVDFMDARIAKRGAEPYLSAAAAEYYESHRGGLSLYSPTSNPHYASYEILSVRQVEGNLIQAMYIVQIAEEYTGTDGPVSVIYEQLGIGPGESKSATIASAERCKNETCR